MAFWLLHDIARGREGKNLMMTTKNLFLNAWHSHALVTRPRFCFQWIARCLIFFFMMYSVLSRFSPLILLHHHRHRRVRWASFFTLWRRASNSRAQWSYNSYLSFDARFSPGCLYYPLAARQLVAAKGKAKAKVYMTRMDLLRGHNSLLSMLRALALVKAPN